MRALKHLLLFVASGVSACVFVACSAVDRGAPPNTALEAVASYTTVVQPILASRCVACHGETKPKGRLRLDTPEGIVAGGVGGYTVVAGRSDESELVRRLHLPLEDEEHMPPSDKEPLSAQQIAALVAWIDAGAPFEGHVMQLEPFLVAQAPEPTAVAPIAPASDAAIAALREALVHVEPVAPGSNGLLVDVSAVAVKVDDALARELLGPVRASVVDLSLARAAIGDATLALLADMPHLTRLDLRGTAVTSAGLVHLTQLASLKELVVAQTNLDDQALASLLACTSLERVHLWRSGLDAAAIAKLRASRPDLVVDAGDTPDATIAEVEPQVRFTSDAPIPGAASVGNEVTPSTATPVNSACPINGAPVDPNVTVVHEGRVIAFCCVNCRAAFAKDPERYAAEIK